MKTLAILFFLCFALTFAHGKPRILVFSKTGGFRHSAIEIGIKAIRKLGEENKFRVDATEDASTFNVKNLKKYDAVVFLNTTQDVLNEHQQDAFTGYIRSGGGFVGIHAASDTEYDWPWYGKLVGAYFNGHPQIQQANIILKDKSHISSQHLPNTWTRTDEWYNFKDLNPSINVLLTIDEESYEGGTNGDYHPISWYHAYDGGRAFYTAMGHTGASYEEEDFLQHILGGINYAMGND